VFSFSLLECVVQSHEHLDTEAFLIGIPTEAFLIRKRSSSALYSVVVALVSVLARARVKGRIRRVPTMPTMYDPSKRV